MNTDIQIIDIIDNQILIAKKLGKEPVEIVFFDEKLYNTFKKELLEKVTKDINLFTETYGVKLKYETFRNLHIKLIFETFSATFLSGNLLPIQITYEKEDNED